MRILLVLLCLVTFPALAEEPVPRDAAEAYWMSGGEYNDLNRWQAEEDAWRNSPEYKARFLSKENKTNSEQDKRNYENAPEIIRGFRVNFALIQELYRISGDGAVPEEYVPEAKEAYEKIESYWSTVNPDMDLEHIRAEGTKEGVKMAQDIMTRVDNPYDKKIEKYARIHLRILKD